MIRILIPTFYSNYGGSVRVMIESARILKERYSVTVKAPLKEADISNLSIPPTMNKIKQILYTPIFVVKIINEFIYMYINKFDIIYVHDYPSLLIYSIVSKVYDIPIVYHMNDVTTEKISRKYLDYLVDFCICINPVICTKKKRCHYIPNFVEWVHNPSLLEKKNHRKKKKLIIGIIASISPNKNQLFGVLLTKRLRNAKLYLYGDILDKKYFNKLNVDNRKIFYFGYKDKKDIFKQVDIVLMPSVQETFGLAYLEGLASNVPAVVPNKEPFSSTMNEIGFSECLYEDGNLDSCIDTINKVLSINIEDVSQKIRYKFSRKRFEDNLFGLFENIEALCVE